MNSAPSASTPFLAAWALAQREVVRFFRQRNRVIGAIGQPVLFWLLFGAGLQRSFRLSDSDDQGQSFLEYYFPGTLVLILLFTAIFATISIIEDRREGFLQSVLIAPAPRWSMVLGKVAGGSAIAVFQGLIFLALALTLQIEMTWLSLLAITALLILTALALTSLGFVLAWRMESTQGFHAIMNLLLMPMWLLSGAFFPPPAVGPEAPWSQWVMHVLMRANPLTYAVGGVRRTLYLGAADGVDPRLFWTPSLSVCWLVTMAFAALAFAAAWRIAGQRTTGDLLS
jgi:ABC-2 type transport system permease protein